MSTQDQSARDGRTESSAGTPAGEPSRQYVARHAPGYDDDAYAETGPTGLAKGFTLLAAVLLMISGVWNFLEGLSALIKGSFYLILPNYAYNLSVTGWGWWHLVMGVVVFAAGACLLLDMTWARIAGIVIASLSAISNFLYIPYQPVWSVIIIALDVFVIWALLAPRRR
jgi:hypothetical protein